MMHTGSKVYIHPLALLTCCGKYKIKCFKFQGQDLFIILYVIMFDYRFFCAIRKRVCFTALTEPKHSILGKSKKLSAALGSASKI